MLYAGSHYKNQKELIEWFTSQKDENGNNLYNCTAMIWKDNKDLKAKENLHLYRLDTKKPYDEEIVSSTRTMDELIEQMMHYYLYIASLMNERSHIIDDFRAENFELVFIDCEYLERKAATEIGAPIMQQIFYYPEMNL